MPAGDSPLARFTSGEGVDDRGRTLAQVQAFDVRRMEAVHDFIQWMFPLRDRSAYNPGAPVLTDADVAAFHARPELRAALARSFEVFLRFLGLEYAGGAVVDAEGLASRRQVFTHPNHNWLRITRVLACLRTLGLEEECRAFFAYLERAHRAGVGVTDDTFAYWRDAAG
jgi:Opioid growth factor receptor (OGFr) conserved region